MTNPPPRPSRSFPARPSGAQKIIDQDEVEKQAALRDVMEHAVRETRAVATAKQMVSWRAQPIVLAVTAAVCFAFAVYAQVAHPDFVFGPDPARAPAAQREAGLRFGMYLLGQRLQQFRQLQGRLPQSLDNLDESYQGITYTVLSGSIFELRTVLNGAAIVYTSDQPVDAFLGSSINLVRRRR